MKREMTDDKVCEKTRTSILILILEDCFGCDVKINDLIKTKLNSCFLLGRIIKN